MIRRPPRSTLFPYTSSSDLQCEQDAVGVERLLQEIVRAQLGRLDRGLDRSMTGDHHDLRVRVELARSEEHTSELQSQSNLVCRLLLEKKKRQKTPTSRRAHD